MLYSKFCEDVRYLCVRNRPKVIIHIIETRWVGQNRISLREWIIQISLWSGSIDSLKTSDSKNDSFACLKENYDGCSMKFLFLINNDLKSSFLHKDLEYRTRSMECFYDTFMMFCIFLEYPFIVIVWKRTSKKPPEIFLWSSIEERE